jgi:putative membrane protein
MKLHLCLIAAELCACRADRHDDQHHHALNYEYRPTQPAQQELPPSSNGNYSTHSPSIADGEFVTKATQTSNFEVDSSLMALDKSVSEATRVLAQMLSKDHRKAVEKLNQICEDKGMKPAARLTPEQRLVLDELSGLEGHAFDRRFHEVQVEAHDQAILDFEAAGREIEDPDLRRFAAETLPTLREHRRYLDEHPIAP